MEGKRVTIELEKLAVIAGAIEPTSGRQTVARATVRRTRLTSERVGWAVTIARRAEATARRPDSRLRTQGESDLRTRRARASTERAIL
ncbi:MAG: hypothetical protein DRI81_13915 [Chloroflexi bacterium]|nr:MAG: hypothetical protein DRI81_13915 [Chloroflexota bacterium]